MIREAIVPGETYAVLHGSVRDRSKARQFVVTLVPDEGAEVYGFWLDDDGKTAIEANVPTRLIRCTWQQHLDGYEPPKRNWIHKDPADWLRRIARHPDASAALRQAALDQLASIN